MRSIPFKLPDVGLSEVSGFVYFDEEFLVFEVEKALFGEFDGEGQMIKIEPKAVVEIELKKGMFKDKLCIRPKKRDLLRAMPGTFKEEIKLSVSHKYREDAYDLVEEFRRRV